MNRIIMLASFMALNMAVNRSCYAQDWVNVGSSCFSTGQADYISMAIDGIGTPYVFYRDRGVPCDCGTVMKFNGSVWETVDTPGSIPGWSENNQHSLAIDGGGTPYVVFADQNFLLGNPSVMKFTGGHWVYVGSAGFANGEDRLTMALDPNGMPYVVYEDDGFTNLNATVMKYTGSSWETVGNPGFSAGMFQNNSIAVDGSGTPYVVYVDLANSNKATTMKYNGSIWVPVGSPGFSAGEAEYTSIAIDGSGTPYVAYEDVANDYKATVMKYTGGNWVTVGSAGFSAGGVGAPSIAIDRNGTPYVVYPDGNTSNSNATVMKFNGSDWVPFGSPGFSTSSAPSPSIAIDSIGTPFVAYPDYSCTNSQATVMKPGVWAGVKNVPVQPVTSIWAFPNPCRSSFTIKLSCSSNEEAEINITNILGEIVKEIKIQSNKETGVEMEVPPGIYFISAKTKSEIVIAKILVE